jgi:ribonucleoside-diphosphate reductase alpha chain
MVTAHEVSPQWHVKIQAAFQAHVDNAVSKTVNLPADASPADVDEIYKLAFKLGCKGITVYRDNARDNQVFKAVENNNTDDQKLSLKPRQRITTGKTIKYRMGCGTLFVTVNKDENGLCEVFANLGKAGGCPSQSEATCRAISAALRSGVKPEILIEQLKSIRCLSTIAGRKTNKDIDVLSCPDAIATALQQALGYSEQPKKNSSKPKCPECNYALRKEAGCNVCDNCGYSKCG